MAAVLPLDFSPQNLPALIGTLNSQKEAAVRAVPGVTAQIADAAAAALQEAFKCHSASCELQLQCSVQLVLFVSRRS